MGLYFGLPFAFYALAKIWNKKAGGLTQKLSYTLVRIAILGIVFVATLAIVWFPWVKVSLTEPGHPNGIQSILTRIFPVKRGLF